MSEKEAIEWVDSSAIDLFLECGLRFKLEVLEGLLSPGGPSHHLLVGGAFAAAVDTLRRTGDLARAAIALADNFPWDIQNLGPKTFHNTLLALTLYDERFSSSPLWETVASEFTFTVDIPGHPNVSYVGRIDALLRHKATGGLFILDDKTTGKIGPKWVNKWLLRGQFIGYVWALRSLGFEVDGVVCRGIKLSSSPELYEVGPILIQPHLLSMWEKRLTSVVTLMVRGPYLPSMRDNCSWCPWHQACLSGDWTAPVNQTPWHPVSGDLPIEVNDDT